MSYESKVNRTVSSYGQKTEPMASKPEGIGREPEDKMPLLTNNYILVAIAAVFIIVGFILIGGAKSGFDAYNPEIFSTRRLVVGPTLSFLGFVLMFIAILVKPRKIEK